MGDRTVSAILFLLPAAHFAAQATDAAPAPLRIVTITAGIGNSMGWFGLQGERYFARDRLSAFLGAGYTPSIDEGDPSGATFAAGIRGFTAGLKHRGFLEASVSQIFIESGFVERPRRLYGPGLAAGYQFASRGGFTLMVSLGLGYAPGAEEYESESAFGGLINLGLGYTWRRRE
jgi:hypothetical protein